MPKAKPSNTERSVAPFDFVLEELAPLAPVTRPLFGCLAVYIGEKIVLALRRKDVHTEDNGVWVATTAEHRESLKAELPSLRSIQLFGDGPTGWQVVPEDSPDFTSEVYLACELIRRGDPRIGKVPKPKRANRKQ
jgi:hypothetical protein